jgi:uncharacterized membrane protein
MRDLTKTLTFACLHFGVGFGVTYALTGSLSIATGVAMIEPAVNTVVFYLHEKAWAAAGARSTAATNNRLNGDGHGHGSLITGLKSLAPAKPPAQKFTAEPSQHMRQVA